MTLPPPEWLPAIGARAARVRTELGMSRLALAQAAGVGRGAVRRLGDARAPVLLDTAYQIATALGVRVGDLLAEPDASPLDRPVRIIS